MTEFIKKHFVFIEIAILFVVSLTPLLWFSPNHMVIGMDSGYPVDFVNRFFQRLYTWFAAYNFGMDLTPGVGQLSLYGLLAFVKSTGIQVYSVQKITFVFWFFAMAISMYSFIRYLYSQPGYWIIRLTAVFVYIYNFHLFSFWIQGEQTAFVAYTLLPLVMLVLFKFIRSEMSPLKSALLLNIIYFFFNAGGIYGVPLLGPILIAAVTAILFYGYMQFTHRGNNFFKRFILLIIYFVPLFLALNAYFILPFLSSFKQQYSTNVDSAGGITSAISWAKYVSRYDSYINLFRLQGDNSWYENTESHYSYEFLHNPILITISFLFPIIAYLSILFVKNRKEKRDILFFILLSLIAVFFSSGIHDPLGSVYEAFMRYIPGFVAFRSPYYKFIISLYFSLSVLIGISVYYISQKTRFRYILGVLILFLILGYHYPFFQRERITFDKPLSPMLEVPSYIMEFSKMRNSASDDYRTLVVPPFNETHQLKAYKWGYVSVSALFPSITDKSFLYNSPGTLYEGDFLIRALYEKLRNKKYNEFIGNAKRLNIRYILLTEDIAFNYRDGVTEDPKQYKNLLDDKDFFHVAWKKGQWTLYEIINSPKDNKIVATDALTFFSGNNTDVTDPFSLTSNFFAIEENQLTTKETEDIFSKFPVSNMIYTYRCESCSIAALFAVKPEITYSQIVSGSLFYPLKSYLETAVVRKSQSQEQLLDAYLGLSLKRSSEIKTLSSVSSEKIVKDSWKNTFSQLIFYWVEIDNIIRSNYINDKNYSKLSKVYQYNFFISDFLKSLYTDVSLSVDDPRKIIIADALWQLKLVHETLEPIMGQYDWETTFIYQIDSSKIKAKDIQIIPSSLPKDLGDNPISPKYYTLENKRTSFTKNLSGNTISLPNNDESPQRLVLHFDTIPNTLDDLKRTTIQFPNRAENCLYASVRNYRWNREYIITVNINTLPLQAPFVYVKGIHDTFDTESSKTLYNKYFYPDASFGLNDIDKKVYSFRFSGRQNDKAREVYFCTASYIDPETILQGISVKESFIPKVFIEGKLQNKSTVIPKIEYRKINPTEYTVFVQGAKDPFILGFLEEYSSLWRLSYTDSKALVSDKQIILNGYANGWYIDRKGDYAIKINFYTQKFFVIGLYITAFSVISLIVGVGIYLFSFKKYVRRKN